MRKIVVNMQNILSGKMESTPDPYSIRTDKIYGQVAR
jgi:hypothetical protein